jgi:CRP-like cAMP-binding protein
MADRRRRNWLLKALAQEEYESLRPHLEEVDLPLGTLICESGAELGFAYFPESCVVSIVAVLEDGMTPEMTTIGPEGVVGLAAMLGKPEGTVRNLVCGAIVTPTEGAYGDQERHPGPASGRP